LALAPSDAEAALVAVQRDLGASAVRGVPQGTYRFVPNAGGYALWHGDRAVLSIDASTLEVRVPADGAPYSDRELELYLRNVAPKLLSLRGGAVLHAAAVERDGRLLAFSGESGAGKTTTARAFAETGARPFSEDLLVFRGGRQSAMEEVVLAGEAGVHAWARRAAERLSRDRGEAISSANLPEVAIGDGIPLHTLLFLDAGRRAGAEIRTRRIEGADGMIAIMSNHFLASTSVEAWRRFVAVARRLAETAQLYELTPPAELRLLSAAARTYMATLTS
jgi:hypothetical protein